MRSLSTDASSTMAAPFQRLAERFDFGRYLTLADVGGATGQVGCTVATRHPHLRCTTLDLPPVTALAQRHIEQCGMSRHYMCTA